MFDFAENTKNMTAIEILNYYRNLYYAEPQVTERGIVANAINDVLPNMVEVVRCKDCNNFVPESITVCRHCSLTGMQVADDDDFCSYGVNKDGDGNGS